MGNVVSSAEVAAQVMMDPPRECPVSHSIVATTTGSNLKMSSIANANNNAAAARGDGCPVNHVSVISAN